MLEQRTIWVTAEVHNSTGRGHCKLRTEWNNIELRRLLPLLQGSRDERDRVIQHPHVPKLDTSARVSTTCKKARMLQKLHCCDITAIRSQRLQSSTTVLLAQWMCILHASASVN